MPSVLMPVSHGDEKYVRSMVISLRLFQHRNSHRTMLFIGETLEVLIVMENYKQ